VYDEWIKEGLNNARLAIRGRITMDCVAGIRAGLLAEQDNDLPPLLPPQRGKLGAAARWRRRHEKLCKIACGTAGSDGGCGNNPEETVYFPGKSAAFGLTSGGEPFRVLVLPVCRASCPAQFL